MGESPTSNNGISKGRNTFFFFLSFVQVVMVVSHISLVESMSKTSVWWKRTASLTQPRTLHAFSSAVVTTTTRLSTTMLVVSMEAAMKP